MSNWLEKKIELARAQIAGGNTRIVERRYLPAALGVGVVFGVLISFVAQFLAIIAVMGGGFALGYAARSYVSYRRRQAALNRSR